MVLLVGDAFSFIVPGPSGAMEEENRLEGIMGRIEDALSMILPREEIAAHVEVLLDFPGGGIRIELSPRTAEGVQALVELKGPLA